MSLEFRGVHANFLRDHTAEIDLEGALSCGKTTVCLWKELEALKRHPGIWIFLARYTGDAVKTLLRPAFEQLARIHGTILDWNRDENYYQLENGSRAFAFGLQTQSQDPVQRYGKIRGLPVSRIYVDQAEQVPSDIASELRLRLRPDIEARLRGETYPTQLTFSPNPTNTDHWIAKQFPITNTIKNRKYYALSLFDNAHNLPPEIIENALVMYPPEHPKHQTVILGQRGLNVIGDAIYENLFDRKIHAARVLQPTETGTLIEAFEFGTHNPVWVIGERTYHGGLVLLGGAIGKRLVLDDFLPIVKRTRADWFPNAMIKTCTAPMGESQRNSSRYTLLDLLRQAGFDPQWRETANAPDVQLAMIEQIAGLLRRRVRNGEEALMINADRSRWLMLEPDGSRKETPFMAFAFEGGFVWSDHWVSVSNKEVRQPHNDDEYANIMRCVEHLVLNFCAGQDSRASLDAATRKQREDHPGEPSPLDPRTAWMSF